MVLVGRISNVDFAFLGKAFSVNSVILRDSTSFQLWSQLVRYLYKEVRCIYKKFGNNLKKDWVNNGMSILTAEVIRISD